MLPIVLSAKQFSKRILLALANQKNNIIVVDGPPGTGKSHTIAALTYWANEQKKSVMITSHKQEALDVVDRMLTDKFKSLHPQAKLLLFAWTKKQDRPIIYQTHYRQVLLMRPTREV